MNVMVGVSPAGKAFLSTVIKNVRKVLLEVKIRQLGEHLGEHLGEQQEIDIEA